MMLAFVSHTGKGLEERNPVDGMRTGAGIRYGREPAVREGVAWWTPVAVGRRHAEGIVTVVFVVGEFQLRSWVEPLSIT